LTVTKNFKMTNSSKHTLRGTVLSCFLLPITRFILAKNFKKFQATKHS